MSEIERIKCRISHLGPGSEAAPRLAQSCRIRMDLAEVEEVRQAYAFLMTASSELQRGIITAEEATFSFCK